MIKFAAIMTSAALACSGASCTNTDVNAACLHALRCARPAAVLCEELSACAGSCRMGCMEDLLCNLPALPPANDSTVPEAPDASPDVQPEQSPVSAYAQEVVRLVNIERANAGLPALAMDAQLSAAAAIRAEEIDASFSHTRPDGTSCFTELRELGIAYRACVENIAKGSPTPARVVEGWMNSAGHRANILNKNFTTIGVGVHEDAAGVMHWAQLFTA